MLAFLTRSRARQNQRKPSFVRPTLEALEARYCLSISQILPTGTLGQPPVHVAQTSSPVITSFTATSLGANKWTFSGQISASTYQDMTVTFGGLPSLQGITISVNTNGSFSYTAQLQSGEAGWATAQATDCNGLLSNVASVEIVLFGNGTN